MSKLKTTRKAALRIIIAAIIIILLTFGGLVAHNLLHVSHSLHSISEYEEMYPNLNIKDYSEDIMLLSPKSSHDTDTGILFYPGATVETTAYIPFLAELCNQGYTCYVFKMPFNLALFAPDRANEIIDTVTVHDYWYISGHSAGGAAATMYAKNYPEKINGVIVISSTTRADISTVPAPLVSVYGELDTVIGSSYNKNLSHNPKDTEIYCIEGANHANFGDYGKQMLDTEATISPDEQRKDAALYITDWIERKKHDKFQ